MLPTDAPGPVRREQALARAALGRRATPTWHQPVAARARQAPYFARRPAAAIS
jgi:hypothetical protein